MRYFFFLLVTFIFYSSFFVSETYAARIAVTGNHTVLHVGDVVQFEIELDPETETLNAVDVTLTFPPELLLFKTSSVKDSLISMWIEKPTFDGTERIHFSGITPGGITTKGSLLQVEFLVVAEGQDLLSFTDSTVLLHDGTGSEAELKTHDAHITVLPGVPAIKAYTKHDDEAPEAFTPVITSDPDVYDGQVYIVFETQDKLSGMSHYEIKEGIFGWYRLATSPYLIMHQALDRTVYLKAIDKAGNEQVSIIYPQNKLAHTQHIIRVLSILIVCFVLIFLNGVYLRRQYWRSRSV